MDVLMNKIYEQEKEAISHCVGCLQEENWWVVCVVHVFYGCLFHGLYAGLFCPSPLANGFTPLELMC
jgi:hypothetical protein